MEELHSYNLKADADMRRGILQRTDGVIWIPMRPELSMIPNVTALVESLIDWRLYIISTFSWCICPLN